MGIYSPPTLAHLPATMSALGQKQTYALQQAMSALHPIATAKAKFRKGHVRFTPESGHVRATRDVGFGPQADLTGGHSDRATTPSATLSACFFKASRTRSI